MFNVKKLDDEIIRKVVTPSLRNYVELSNPKDSKERCVMTQRFADLYVEKIKKFEVFEDDVWVITVPKAGTTWTQEMVWLLNNDMDFETALKVSHMFRFPHLEVDGLGEMSIPMDTIEMCKKLSRPRHFKSHLPAFLLPDQLWTVKPKIIYTARNPNDVAISYFHHYRHLQGYEGSREDFLAAFLDDKVLHAPFNEHVLDFWKLSKENSNILFLFYEDMKKDLDHEVKKVAKFLGKSYTQEQIDKACNHLSIDSMRKNPSCNFETIVDRIKKSSDYSSSNEKFTFIREGNTGSYKKEMSDEEIEKFEKYRKYPEFKAHAFAYKY